MFVTSGKAHVAFYVTFGLLTKFVSLDATAWIGRVVAWLFIAVAFQRLSWLVSPVPYASLMAALVWIVGVEQADLAGEWVIGGIEAKVPAYGFVLLALVNLFIGRWYFVWPFLGAASAFHVLVGGWSVLAAGFAFLLNERFGKSYLRQIVPLAVGGAIALCGVLPGLATMQGVDPAVAQEAAKIYTYERISHHLYPASFALKHYLQHGALIFLTAGLCWPLLSWKPASAEDSDKTCDDHARGFRRLCGFAAGSVLIGLAGLLVGMLPAVAPDLAARLLRFYWFRLTDAIVPLMLGLSLAMWCGRTRRSQRAFWLVTSFAVGCSLWLAIGFWQRQRVPIPEAARQSLISFDQGKPADYQIQIYADWRRLCDWVHLNSGEDDVFLSSRHQQSFKWFADRAEVVNWKDVPQDATSLLEWKRRMNEVFPRRLGKSRVTFGYAALREFREQYGVEYMIIDRRITWGNVPLVKVYPLNESDNKTFAVYRLP